MAVANLGTGEPIVMSIINTDPKQLRSWMIASDSFNIRIAYIAEPTAITSDSQDLDLPDVFHELLFLKFVSKTALAVGETQLSGEYEILYQRLLADNKQLARQNHEKSMRVRFSWI